MSRFACQVSFQALIGAPSADIRPNVKPTPQAGGQGVPAPFIDWAGGRLIPP
jgi:hypothetical protein